MSMHDGGPLEAARLLLGLSLERLWLDYATLGGNLTAEDVGRFLTGRAAVAPGDYDRLAVALNERFMDRNEDHPVRYAEDL